MDFEMEIENHYHEILHLVHNLFKFMFDRLESKYKLDLSIIRKSYDYEPLVIPESPLILSFADAVKLLRDDGHAVGDYDDFSTPTEIILGKIVKLNYNSDFFILGE